MKHLLCFFFFSAFFFPSKSQDMAFTLKGKIQQPSSVSALLIAYPEMHMDSISINADGSFTYSGNFSEPGEMQITTRKSTTSIWLDSGIKNVYLSEKPDRNGKMKLTVDSVVGSEDTYLYYYTSLPKQIKVSDTIFSQPRRFYSQQDMETYLDSLRKASKANKPSRDSLWRDISFRKIDSIFKVRPDSKVLPWLIGYYELTLGLDLMQKFYCRLNTEQQQSAAGKDLLNVLNRLQLLKPGNIFNDFTMKDDHAKDFKFSSLKSKYVLIDFWASYCGPCRGRHLLLREAYLKTKGAGLEIVSISLDEDRQKWLDAVKQDMIEWINVCDLKGSESPIARKYNITGIPFSLLLDENRKVILIDPSTYQIIDFFSSLR
jgi:thiol-disulfide isomerase/thioredoxin